MSWPFQFHGVNGDNFGHKCSGHLKGGLEIFSIFLSTYKLSFFKLFDECQAGQFRGVSNFVTKFPIDFDFQAKFPHDFDFQAKFPHDFDFQAQAGSEVRLTLKHYKAATPFLLRQFGK